SPVLLAVADDAAVDLVDLLKAAVLHQRAEHLTPDPAGAVADDRLVLHPVVLAALQFLDEVVGGLHIRDDGVLEPADFGLHRVTPIEEDDVVAALLDQLVDLFRLQVGSSPNDAVLVDLQLTRRAEGDDLVAHLDGQAREVLRPALRPLELHALEAGVFAGAARVLLAGMQGATDGAVDAVFGDKDAPGQSEAVAELLLPQHYRRRVRDGREPVVQQDAGFFEVGRANSHASKCSPTSEDPLNRRE